MLIKSAFFKCVDAGESIRASRVRKGERGIWQRRFWEHQCVGCVRRDERDLSRHVDDVHFNPVKHGHAKRAANWPHSSIHRYIARGELSADWAAPQDIADVAWE